MNFLEEILIVLAYSTRTQVAILMGIVSSIALLICGYFAVDTFHLSGPFAYLTETLKPYFMLRYEAAAIGSLFSFLGLAFKLYRKDRKRILGNW